MGIHLGRFAEPHTATELVVEGASPPVSGKLDTIAPYLRVRESSVFDCPRFSF